MGHCHHRGRTWVHWKPLGSTPTALLGHSRRDPNRCSCVRDNCAARWRKWGCRSTGKNCSETISIFLAAPDEIAMTKTRAPTIVFAGFKILCGCGWMPHTWQSYSLTRLQWLMLTVGERQQQNAIKVKSVLQARQIRNEENAQGATRMSRMKTARMTLTT
jgi:hypothetical protein